MSTKPEPEITVQRMLDEMKAITRAYGIDPDTIRAVCLGMLIDECGEAEKARTIKCLWEFAERNQQKKEQGQ